ncbi:unnamed protein product [Hymenolepis diminuta]|uniref:Uncharacterized protein n=1 Tax=Hymenolepis diminuta TaxID=6216 RepID=A0A564YQC1_HYMDI|nr:unnamed protein product [Hymenolepis diminuta]
MSPPSFKEIGSKVKDFSVENTFWLSPNIKLNFISRKDPTVLFSLVSHPPNYVTEKFYSYYDSNRPILYSTLNTSFFKDVQLSFTYCQPASFKSTLTFPLFSDSFQQEISGALSNNNARTDTNAPFDDPTFSSRTSYTSDNIVAAFETDVRDKKIKSYLSLVLGRNNFFIAPRFGISLKKLSRYYVDLKLAYERNNVEVFTYFTWRKLHSLTNWHFGILHKTPGLDLGFYSVIKDKANTMDQSFLTVCYKPNSWSFLKCSLANNLMYTFYYGFTFTEGIVTTLGFSSDLKQNGPCCKFNVSFSMDL